MINIESIECEYYFDVKINKFKIPDSQYGRYWNL